MSFSIASFLEIRDDQTDETLARGSARISGNIRNNEDGTEFAEIEVEVREAGTEQSVFLTYRMMEREGEFDIELPDIPRTYEPATDYAVCVALKLSSTIGGAAHDCWKKTDTWKEFLDCMKQKAPDLGRRAIWHLFVCLRKLSPI